MAQAGVPITNTLFPPPPGYYKAYTPENVARLAELRGSDDNDAGPSSPSPSTSVPDAQPAPAEPGELEELTAAQDPPRADWVLEEGRWMLFGQMYTVRTTYDFSRCSALDCGGCRSDREEHQLCTVYQAVSVFSQPPTT